jgi:hypothetical protein
LFSDLGSGSSIYDSTSYWAVYGSGSIYGEGGLVYNTFAARFTAAGTGSEAVTLLSKIASEELDKRPSYN